jgi:hypothetical protein
MTSVCTFICDIDFSFRVFTDMNRSKLVQEKRYVVEISTPGLLVLVVFSLC